MSDKIKKLSQAIRLGATFRPEWRNGYYSPECGTCAVYAAAEALGYPVEERFDANDGNDYIEAFKFIAAKLGIDCSIISNISCRHLFGNETREQIADWLEAKGL